MRTCALSEEAKNNDLKFLSLCNLGLLHAALGYSEESIHNFEEAHRLVSQNNMSTNYLLRILELLSLSYLNNRASRKAIVTLKMNIGIRELRMNDEENNKDLLRLKNYLTYTIDNFIYHLMRFKKTHEKSKLDVVRNKTTDLKAESEVLIDYIMNNDIRTPDQIFNWFSDGNISHIYIFRFH